MTETLASAPLVASRSSLFEKLPADFRRKLDQAVIDRDPPGYRALFNKFNLAARGVSHTAFSDSARRLRAHADLAHLAELVRPGDVNPADLIPFILAHRLLDASSDEATSPRTLHRLAETWRIVTSTRLNLERHAALLQNDDRKHRREETDVLCRLVRQYAQVVKNDLHATASSQDA
ncbi:MAG: hypothetical protein V3T70_11775 [Phycisphaerae bacterium]